MADKQIHLEIITPDTSVFEGDVDFVVVRAVDGELGILPNHAPLIASLDISGLRYTKDDKKEYFFVAGGFMEVKNNRITIAAPSAESATAIDIERAGRAEKRARERLSKSAAERQAEHIDMQRAELALRRALERQRVARRNRG